VHAKQALYNLNYVYNPFFKFLLLKQSLSDTFAQNGLQLVILLLLPPEVLGL
jgi:hypothetical protein